MPGLVQLSKALLLSKALPLSKACGPVALLLVALPLALQAQPSGRGDGFGRWQPAVRRCRSVEPRQVELSCQAVLVDQRGSGVFRIRWGLTPWRQLTFVGILSGPSQPMTCRQAVCRLQWPITLAISGVSSNQFVGSGVASGLPLVWSARGQCRLSADQLSCEAQALTGERWSVEAQLR